MSADNRKVNLRDLDINSIGSWPRQAQLVFCGFVALLIVALGWWLFVRDKGNELALMYSMQRQNVDTIMGAAGFSALGSFITFPAAP